MLVQTADSRTDVPCSQHRSFPVTGTALESHAIWVAEPLSFQHLRPLQVGVSSMYLREHFVNVREVRKSIAKVLGRGVWESNPPGTAPSDPPAVLKTVRPTGAPTPPYAWLYFAIHLYSCQARTVFLTKCSDALYIYLGQALHHQLCFA